MDRSQTDTTGDPGKSGVRLRGQTGDGSQSDTETIKNHNQIEPIDAQIQTETTGDPHQIETGDGGRTEATGERDQTETGGRAGSSHNNKTNYNILTGSHQIPVSCTGTNPTIISPAGALLDRKAVGTPSASGMYQRRHSATLPSSKFNQNQFVNSLKVDPSPTLGNGSSNKENRFRDRSFSEGGERLLQKSISMTGSSSSQVNSSRYKTELCRPFEENGACKYGDKCQFAHGVRELRSLNRHPKYKTELCRTFHTIGFCPYGPRCHFVHNAEERRGPPLSTSNKVERPRLQHSYSFAGFSSTGSLQDSPTSVTPPPIFSTEDLSGWPSNPFTYSSQELGNLFGPSLGGVFSGDISTQAPSSPTAGYFRPTSESPSSPPESLSDQEGYQSSSGSLSGSESPVLDATRRLPIFSRLSISDD